MIQKICEVCGREFLARNGRARWCSAICRYAGQAEDARLRYMKKVVTDLRGTKNEKAIKECAMCGKQFLAKRMIQKYCSKACAWNAKQIQSQKKDKPTVTPAGTLCWQCEWSTGKDGKCPWARCFKPVKGWVAKKTRVKIGDNKYTDSYKVKECPLFSEG